MRAWITMLCFGLSFVYTGVSYAADSVNAKASADIPKAMGIWLTSGGKSKVRISRCQNGSGELCSKVIWLRRPFGHDGKPQRDVLNENYKLRRRQVLGIPILMGMRSAGDGRWWLARAYDPERGKTFNVKIWMRSTNTLAIKGCLPLGWPCQTRYWQRTTENVTSR